MRVIASLTISAAMAAVVVAQVPLKASNNIKSVGRLVQSGKHRLKRFNKAYHGVPDSSPVTNEEVSYLANMTIGGETYSLIVDTGCKLTRSDMSLTDDTVPWS